MASTTVQRTLINLTGQRFGRLVVGLEGTAVSGDRVWSCRCDCGNDHTARQHDLRTGRTQSCGCLHRERTSDAVRVHGQSRTRVYRIWSSMKRRCLNPDDPSYARYGGRGITIAQEWIDSYERFAADVGPRPSRSHSIHRVDNDGPYAKWNVEWTTDDVQRANKRTSHYIAFNGETMTIKQWSSRLGLSYGLIHDRLRMGWPVVDAMTRPVGPQGRRPKVTHRA